LSGHRIDTTLRLLLLANHHLKGQLPQPFFWRLVFPPTSIPLHHHSPPPHKAFVFCPKNLDLPPRVPVSRSTSSLPKYNFTSLLAGVFRYVRKCLDKSPPYFHPPICSIQSPSRRVVTPFIRLHARLILPLMALSSPPLSHTLHSALHLFCHFSPTPPTRCLPVTGRHLSHVLLRSDSSPSVYPNFGGPPPHLASFYHGIPVFKSPASITAPCQTTSYPAVWESCNHTTTFPPTLRSKSYHFLIPLPPPFPEPLHHTPSSPFICTLPLLLHPLSVHPPTRLFVSPLPPPGSHRQSQT